MTNSVYARAAMKEYNNLKNLVDNLNQLKDLDKKYAHMISYFLGDTQHMEEFCAQMKQEMIKMHCDIQDTLNEMEYLISKAVMSKGYSSRACSSTYIIGYGEHTKECQFITAGIETDEDLVTICKLME